MQTPSAKTLLEVVERGARQASAFRALLLLDTAFPEATVEQLAGLPIGVRNRHLLRLRARLFGDVLDSVVDCPECGEALEVALRVDELLNGPPAGATAGPEREERVGDYVLRVRFPTSMDLLEASRDGAQTAPGHLARRCVRTAEEAGRAVDPEALPDSVLAALGQRLAEADPQAVLELKLCCPACAHAWIAPLDVEGFLWTELEHWAKRIVHEVHRLARAYGWREADILRLTPWRRRAYLELISS